MLKNIGSIKKSYKRLALIVVIFVVAILGTLVLIDSHAASPYASINADQGVLANGAVKQNCSGANDGSCIEFSTGSSTTGPMDGNVALSLTISGTPFASTSFWNTPLPASIPANPNNAAYNLALTYALCHDTPPTGSLAALTPPSSCTTPTFHGALNTSAWSAPLYVVPANQSTVNIDLETGCNTSNNFALARANVPIPTDAHGAGDNSDSEIQIYQPSTNKEWEFWHFIKEANGNWSACYGGIINNVSQSNGIFPNNTGATATSLPLLGGVIRIEELQAGQINHVMNLSTQSNLVSGIPVNIPGAIAPYSWPATRNDGSLTDLLSIPEGTRFRLNPNLNLNTLSLSPVAKTIAIAAQKYGFVVDDRSSGVSIRLGDPTTYTTAGLANPYTSGMGVGGVGTSGLFGNGSNSMNNFPWDQLQALPYNYGEPPWP